MVLLDHVDAHLQSEMGKYLSGEMVGSEREQFEKRLREDQQFWQSFVLYKSFYAQKSWRLYRGDPREVGPSASRKIAIAKVLTTTGLGLLGGALTVGFFTLLFIWLAKG